MLSKNISLSAKNSMTLFLSSNEILRFSRRFNNSVTLLTKELPSYKSINRISLLKASFDGITEIVASTFPSSSFRSNVNGNNFSSSHSSY